MDEKVLVTCDSGLKLCTFACKTTICCVSSAGKTEQRRLLLKTTQCPFGLCTLCYVITCNLNSEAFWLETPKTIIRNPVFRYPKCLGVQTVSFSSGTSQLPEWVGEPDQLPPTYPHPFPLTGLPGNRVKKMLTVAQKILLKMKVTKDQLGSQAASHFYYSQSQKLEFP